MRGAAGLVEKTKENFKERAEERKKAPKKPAKPMSETEAEELKETYHQALAGMFELSDQIIKWTSGGHEEVEIWSTIDDADIDVIVEVRLEEAKHSARAAAGVRRTINYYHRIKVGAIVLPRAWQTMEFYSEHGINIPLHFGRKRRKLRTVESKAV